MKQLHIWFESHKREFPWRQDPSPYKVWVSEVMLQQTRASVVVPYFIRWIKQFPDVKSLADAKLEDVIKVWEGLGYYSRARNLHEGAKEMRERFGGEIPSSQEDLKAIRGLGPYTIGAILSFGFHQRAPAVDGNVIRVLTRYFLIEENVSKAPTRRLLQEKAESLLDVQAPWITAEALIELGATLCLPKPLCGGCPLRANCLAFKANKAEALPIKNNPPETTDLFRMVAIIESEGYFLVKKETKGKIMADLYEFPYFQIKKETWGSFQLMRAVKDLLGLETRWIRQLPDVQHMFTRYRVRLYPVRLYAEKKVCLEGWEWISKDKLSEIPFSSGHRKILLRLQ
jgi:A/G-specific adenine glycosylase